MPDEHVDQASSDGETAPGSWDERPDFARCERSPRRRNWPMRCPGSPTPAVGDLAAAILSCRWHVMLPGR